MDIQLGLGPFYLRVQTGKSDQEIKEPGPLPRFVPRLQKNKSSYRFISPLKEIEKARERQEMLPHPIE